MTAYEIGKIRHRPIFNHVSIEVDCSGHEDFIGSRNSNRFDFLFRSSIQIIRSQLGILFVWYK